MDYLLIFNISFMVLLIGLGIYYWWLGDQGYPAAFWTGQIFFLLLFLSILIETVNLAGFPFMAWMDFDLNINILLTAMIGIGIVMFTWSSSRIASLRFWISEIALFLIFIGQLIITLGIAGGSPAEQTEGIGDLFIGVGIIIFVAYQFGVGKIIFAAEDKQNNSGLFWLFQISALLVALTRLMSAYFHLL